MQKGARYWQISDRLIDLAPFTIIGIVNTTPDSFYDGGKFFSPKKACAHALQLVSQGAKIIDFGAESTRPYANIVDAQTEINRLIPTIKAFKIASPNTLISVDTRKSDVASIALELGVHIINDVSGGLFDPKLIEIIADKSPGYVLMHSQGTPENMQNEPKYNHIIDEIKAYFEAQLNKLIKKGLKEETIVLDPGIGFGKNANHNLEILQNIQEFNSLGRPIYMGLSNKSIWQHLFNLTPNERVIPTITATAYLVKKGIYIHRVHQVLENYLAICTMQQLD